MTGWWRRRYGASPLHLLGHLAALAVAAYAVRRILAPHSTGAVNAAAWLVGGALVHDGVFVPLYATLDWLVGGADLGRVRWRNHVRVPVATSAVLFLVYWPSITDQQAGNVVRAAGRPRPDELGRWLLITVALLAGSAVVYAVRVRRARPAGG